MFNDGEDILRREEMKRDPEGFAKIIEFDFLNQFKRRYEEFLKTKQWQMIRQTVLKRDNFTCQDCGDKANHVHHLKYDDFEDMTQMISLCKRCHEHRHGRPFNASIN